MAMPVSVFVPELAPPAEGEDIEADYRSVGFTLGRHPVALLRKALTAGGVVESTAINLKAAGRFLRTAGLVTCRQSPQTASGVIFVTVEDENGCVNVVVWNDVFQRYRQIVLDSELLGVEGMVESDGQVVHLLARRFVDHTPLLRSALGPLAAHSHDFH